MRHSGVSTSRNLDVKNVAFVARINGSIGNLENEDSPSLQVGLNQDGSFGKDRRSGHLHLMHLSMKQFGYNGGGCTRDRPSLPYGPFNFDTPTLRYNRSVRFASITLSVDLAS